MAEKDRPKIYIDSCCIISLASYQRTGEHEDGRKVDNDYLGKILLAAEAGDLDLYTSSLTIAECQSVGKVSKDAGEEVQRLFDSVLLSGHFLTYTSSDVFIGIRARDLNWKYGIKNLKGADAVHLASAIKEGCKEFLTFDGDGKKKNGLLHKADVIKKASGLRVIIPSQTLYLPDEYLQDDIFTGEVVESVPERHIYLLENNGQKEDNSEEE